MNYEEFLDKVKPASKKFEENKKSPKTPDKQFMKGAIFAWELLKGAKDVPYYEEKLRSELIDRIGEVEAWKESLITDTAVMMADRDGMIQDIMATGRLLDKWDKNNNLYRESNPLYVHLKEKERSIGLQREHLGLSNKVNPARVKEDAKKGVDETDPMVKFYKS